MTFSLLLAWECEKNQRCRKADGCTGICLCPRSVKGVAKAFGFELTLRSRHLFSLMAPRQPRKPVTMTMAPMPMTMLAADSAGKEGEKVAKLPWETESQIPTPSSPQPHNCKTKGKRGEQTEEPGLTQKHQAYPPPPIHHQRPTPSYTERRQESPL